jgi:hypothetical protein
MSSLYVGILGVSLLMLMFISILYTRIKSTQ